MEKLRFGTDGSFKIMQIADVQEIPAVSPDTMKLMELALEKEKPDLVVFTGDQIRGYDKSMRSSVPEKIVRELIDKILSPVTKRNILFCVTFGNHDRQSGVPNCVQALMYREYPSCVMGEGRTAEDAGTYSLPVFSSEGDRPAFNIYMLDTNSLSREGGYQPLSAEQVAWLRTERERLMNEWGEYIPSFIFQHIPPREIYDALVRVRRFTKGSVPAFRTHAHEYYKLPEELYKKGMFMRECPAPADVNTGEFDAAAEKGDITGIFFGHDHINSFVVGYRGIDLGYTQGTGFNVYGPGRNRGVRVFELNKNSIRDYKTHTVTFGELTDGRFSNPLPELVYEYAPLNIAKWAYSHMMKDVDGHPM